MLSNELIQMIEELKALEERIEKRMREETNDKLVFCWQPHIQVWADDALVHDKAEVAEALGTLMVKYMDEPDNKTCYKYTLGAVNGVVLLSNDMSDSRSESDDVRANT